MRPTSHATRIVLACLATAFIVGAAVWLNRPVHLPRAGNLLQASSPNQAQPGGSPSGATRIPPDVDPAAFKNQGDLAFIQQGLLYSLDGSTGEVKQLTESGQVSSPAWSSDGQWVAFVRVTDAQAGSGPLWLVRRDGTQAHQVQGLPGPVTGTSFAWSPITDTLAVGQDNGLWLVPTQGEPDQLVATKTAPGFVWSPDGKSLAYSITLPWTDPVKRSDALYTVAVNGGKAVQRLTTPQAGIELAAWWPNGGGLLYWLDGLHSASLAADGLGLDSLRLGDAAPKDLMVGLTYRSWLSFSPGGRLLAVKGGGRTAWADKELTVLNLAAGGGEDLPTPTLPPGGVPRYPAGKVALDPAFSPDGSRIAFVGAKDLGNSVWGFNSDSKLAAWVATRTLWIENADGSGAHPLSSGGTGVYQPAWSRDGKSILYVRDNGLWIIGAAGGTPQRVVGLSPGQTGLFGFYGYVHYDDYAWYQP